MTSDNRSQTGLIDEGGDFSMRTILGTQDPDLAPEARELLEKLSQKTQDERMLRHTDIGATDLSHWLADIMILDLVYSAGNEFSDAQIRLMGSGIASLFGEKTGEQLSALSRTTYERIAKIVNKTNQTHLPVVGHTTKNLLGYKDRTMVGLYMPVSSDTNKIDQLLIHIALIDGQPSMILQKPQPRYRSSGGFLR